MIGTQGSGNAVPGAFVPHGMVKLGPDSDTQAGAIEGYEYGDTKLQGFSHTHLEGPGGSNYGYSEIMLLPQTGTLEVRPSKSPSRFDHATELSAPGYYAVTLEDYQVRAELTASPRVGLHRYTFPSCGGNRILVDIGHTRGRSVGGEVNVVGTDTIEGYGEYVVYPLISFGLGADAPNTGLSRTYFSVKFDRPFEAAGTWSEYEPAPGVLQATGPHAGAYAEFGERAGRVIQARVGISFIDVDQARANREELGAESFDQVRDATASEWSEHLGRIEVEGGSSDQRKMLYTSLFHALMQPADYTEGGRFFVGGDEQGAVREASGRRFFTDDWCAWDTARATYPMLGILDPEVVPDMVQSYVTWYEQAGWISKCSWHARGDSRAMTGNFPFCSIADAWVKGLRDFDAEKAYEAMYKGSMQDSDNPLASTLCGYLGQGTPPDYVSLGYVPKECDEQQAASMTLEHAYADWCVSKLAGGLGKTHDESFFRARSANWRNVWNPEHGFPQLRTRDGQFVEPFDPTSADGFTEADAWKYLWTVPQDLCGLVTAVGGAAAFEAKLDEFFGGGHFDVSNEPDFHAPYLYDIVGAPWKTQELVRSIVEQHFSTSPGGLPGNDDAGATSSWLAFAMLGLYPVAPGSGEYWIGSPAFDRAVVHIGTGGTSFVIEAQGNGPDAPYVQSATLNGQALAEPRIKHEDIVAGAKLVLVMGPNPSGWSSAPVCP